MERLSDPLERSEYLAKNSEVVADGYRSCLDAEFIINALSDKLKVVIDKQNKTRDQWKEKMNSKTHSSSINGPYFRSRSLFNFEIRWHTAIIAIVSLISLVAITIVVGPDEKLNTFFYLIPLIVAVVLKGIGIPRYDERVNRFAVTVFAVVCILLFLFTVLLSQGGLQLCVGEPGFLIWYASATIIAFNAADTINSENRRRASIDEVALSALLLLFSLLRMALKPEFAIALMLLSLEPWFTGRIRGAPMYIGLARSLAAIQFMGQSFQ